MKRPLRYSTKNEKAIISYLASVKGTYVTAAQIAEELRKENGTLSRPTVYRQLDRLVGEGKVRKYLFDGMTASSFQYAAPGENGHESCRLKCEVCDGIFNLKCDEIGHISQHISQEHAFHINENKTIFYGKCKMCL